MQKVTPIFNSKKNFQKLSKNEIQHIGSFLNPKDTGRLELAYFLNGAIKENPVWEDKLTSEARQRINYADPESARNLFRDVEENRLLQYRTRNHFLTNKTTQHLNAVIIGFIKNKKLSIEDALNLNLTYGQITNLSSYDVQKYINNGKLPFNIALNLTYDQKRNLEYRFVQKYIDNDLFPCNSAINLTFEQYHNLNSRHVQKYIDNGKLPLEEAINLTELQRDNLEQHFIQDFIDDGKLSLGIALNLTELQRDNLEHHFIQDCIDSGKLSCEEAINLTELQRDNLSSISVQIRISNGSLTLQNVLKFSVPMID